MPNLKEWEERYQRPDYWAGVEPSAFLREMLPFLPRGPVLDLACGEGRNAVYLAAQGWQVTGVDWSPAGLEKATALALAHGLRATRLAGIEVAGPGTRLGLAVVDLEKAALPVERFDVVLCVNYLQRSLFSAIERALRPGGVLLYQAYTLEQLQFDGGPRSPEFLLRPGELCAAFPRLRTLFCSEHNAGKGVASLFASKAAR